MEIWLDTVNVKAIQDAVKKGIIFGVTTNPSILGKSKHVKETLLELLDVQEGPVAVQVIKETSHEMFSEGMRLFEFSDRMIVKVPMTKEGMEAIHQLCEEGIPVLATGILNPMQVVMAVNLGALYVTPYFSYLGELGNPFETLKTMTGITAPSDSNMLVASLREMSQVLYAAVLGVEAVTIKEDLYEELIKEHPLMEKISQKFRSDWHELHGSLSMIDLLEE